MHLALTDTAPRLSGHYKTLGGEESVAAAVKLVLVISLLHEQPHTTQIASYGSTMQIHFQTSSNRATALQNFKYNQLVVVLSFDDANNNGQFERFSVKEMSLQRSEFFTANQNRVESLTYMIV